MEKYTDEKLWMIMLFVYDLSQDILIRLLLHLFDWLGSYSLGLLVG